MNAAVAKMESAVIGGGLLPPGSGVLVAVSGGRDSMVLLEALSRWRSRQSWRLVVAHFHHQLRGAEADADQAFVAVAAAKSGLMFLSGTADVGALRGPGESWESAARRLRHAFLAGAARGQGCARVALGHHGGDQAELFLLRLLRGAGASGLGGMGEVDPSPADPDVLLVRPLLGFSGGEVEALAQEWGVVFRSDASNQDTAHMRNRIRHELMPWLQSRFQPAVERVLVREQTLLRDQAAFLEMLAKEWLDREPSGATAGTGFDGLAVALQREVLRVQAVRWSLTLGFDGIEALRLRPGVPIQLSPGQRVIRDTKGILRILENRRFKNDLVTGHEPEGVGPPECVAAGVSPAVEPGILPGGKRVWSPEVPGGGTPPSTAGGTPAATDARCMESPLVTSDLLTGHEPKEGGLRLRTGLRGDGGDTPPLQGPRFMGGGLADMAFREEWFEVPLDSGRGTTCFGGGVLSWQVSSEPASVPRSQVSSLDSWMTVECLDADAVGGRVRLRYWRPGDRFQPIGLGAAAKLQDLFTNARVPAVERRQRVLAETERGTLFWVEGLRIGECAKTTASTIRTLTWRWERGSVQTGH